MPSKIAFRAKIARLEYLMGTHYLEIPAAIVKKIGTFKIRLICEVEGRVKFRCGLMALGGGRAYVTLSKTRLKVLGAAEGDRVAVVLRPDASRYGMPMPAELREVLGLDEEGKRRFAAMTPGRKRWVIAYVDGMRGEDLRVERAFAVVERLKRATPGRESARELLGVSEVKVRREEDGV